MKTLSITGRPSPNDIATAIKELEDTQRIESSDQNHFSGKEIIDLRSLITPLHEQLAKISDDVDLIIWLIKPDRVQDFPSLREKWLSQIKSLPTRLVIIPHLSAEHFAEVRHRNSFVVKIVNTTQNLTCKQIFQYIYPHLEEDEGDDHNDPNNRFHEFEEALSNELGKERVFIIDPWQEQLEQFLSFDCVHPNSKGYQFIFDRTVDLFPEVQ